jgi:lipoprotein-anchoring transpeptidase ErfK/SrfK
MFDLQEPDPSSSTQTVLYIFVSKARQHLYVYQNGQLLPGWNWPVSTGTERLRCPPHAPCRIAHTPTGVRHPGILDWEHYSTLYDNAPMHRAIQFTGGIFLHATYGSHIRKLGQRDSGGCVRQYPPNAEKLFLLVRDLIARYSRKAILIEISER